MSGNPPVAGKNHVAVIDDHRIHEAEFPDTGCDLPYLLFRMSSGVPGIGAERSYWDKLGARQ